MTELPTSARQQRFPHWIHAKKSREEGQPVIDVSIVIHNDGQVDFEGDELSLTMWNHDPARLRSALDYWGRAVWKPRYHVLSLPGLSGYLFNLAALDQRAQCLGPDAGWRALGGFTTRLPLE